MERAESKARKYGKEVMLPTSVDVNSKTTKFHNGILEIKFKKLKKVSK